jgi:hypothetical protein
LHMQTDGNVIEWCDGWIILWKTDTEQTGTENYLTLRSSGAPCRAAQLLHFAAALVVA